MTRMERRVSDGFTIEHRPGKVVIAVTVGDKRAILGITPDHAKRMAARLITAALEAEAGGDSSSSVVDQLRDIFNMGGKRG